MARATAQRATALGSVLHDAIWSGDARRVNRCLRVACRRDEFRARALAVAELLHPAPPALDVLAALGE